MSIPPCATLSRRIRAILLNLNIKSIAFSFIATIICCNKTFVKYFFIFFVVIQHFPLEKNFFLCYITFYKISNLTGAVTLMHRNVPSQRVWSVISENDLNNGIKTDASPLAALERRPIWGI